MSDCGGKEGSLYINTVIQKSHTYVVLTYIHRYTTAQNCDDLQGLSTVSN